MMKNRVFLKKIFMGFFATFKFFMFQQYFYRNAKIFLRKNMYFVHFSYQL